MPWRSPCSPQGGSGLRRAYNKHTLVILEIVPDAFTSGSSLPTTIMSTAFSLTKAAIAGKSTGDMATFCTVSAGASVARGNIKILYDRALTDFSRRGPIRGHPIQAGVCSLGLCFVVVMSIKLEHLKSILRRRCGRGVGIISLNASPSAACKRLRLRLRVAVHNLVEQGLVAAFCKRIFRLYGGSIIAARHRLTVAFACERLAVIATCERFPSKRRLAAESVRALFTVVAFLRPSGLARYFSSSALGLRCGRSAPLRNRGLSPSRPPNPFLRASRRHSSSVLRRSALPR